MYPIIEVPANAAEVTEQLGTKPKFWYDDSRLGRCLFKQGRAQTGENWAEKVACELCGLLGLPHALYQLAEWNGIQGVVSPSFVPGGGRLVLGNELIASIEQDYEKTRIYKQTGHTVSRVLASLRSARIQPPTARANDCPVRGQLSP